jgi:hypothetical protein
MKYFAGIGFQGHDYAVCIHCPIGKTSKSEPAGSSNPKPESMGKNLSLLDSGDTQNNGCEFEITQVSNYVIVVFSFAHYVINTLGFIQSLYLI